jgi:formate dehydrogenase major subunit
MNKTSRRLFLKSGAACLAGAAAMTGASPAEAMGRGPERPPLLVDRVVDGNCQFCQVRCTLKVEVRGDKVVNVRGNPDNFWTGGSMCPKGKALVEMASHPDRIMHPMVRKNGKLSRISYAKAVDMVAERLARSMADHPNDYHYRTALLAPLWDSRESELAALLLMHMLGMPNVMAPGECCISTAATTLGLMLGTANSTTTIDEALNTDVLLLWGANLAETYPPYVRWLTAAREKGVKIIYVDVRATPTANLCSAHVQPRSGSDGVLALGVVRHVIHSGQFDESFVAANVSGFEMLRDAAEPWTFEKVREVTGVPEESVRMIGDAVAGSGKAILWLGGCLSRYSNGMQTIRALVSLQGITRHLVGSGNGIINMQGGKPGGDEEFLEHFHGAEAPAGLNARRIVKQMEKGEVDVVFLNATYRRYPDCNTVRNAIQKCGFIVYRGFFMNEEAEIADLILPGTMLFEGEGSQYGAQRQVVWRERVLPVPPEVSEDWRFYRDLGNQLVPQGYPKFESARELYEMAREGVPSWRGITLERLAASPSGVAWPYYAEDEAERRGSIFREDRLLTADGKLAVDSKVLGNFVWDEPKGSPRSKEGSKEYPLFFTQGKVAHHWQHTFTNFTDTAGQFSQGRYVEIHPATARLYELSEGEGVVLRTAVGELGAVVRICNTVQPGMVFTPSHYCSSTSILGNRSAPVNTIVPNNWDRVSAQYNGFGCSIFKENKS